jgi:hypothetical protein
VLSRTSISNLGEPEPLSGTGKASLTERGEAMPYNWFNMVDVLLGPVKGTRMSPRGDK